MISIDKPPRTWYNAKKCIADESDPPILTPIMNTSDNNLAANT